MAKRRPAKEPDVDAGAHKRLLAVGPYESVPEGGTCEVHFETGLDARDGLPAFGVSWFLTGPGRAGSARRPVRALGPVPRRARRAVRGLPPVAVRPVLAVATRRLLRRTIAARAAHPADGSGPTGRHQFGQCSSRTGTGQRAARARGRSATGVRGVLGRTRRGGSAPRVRQRVRDRRKRLHRWVVSAGAGTLKRVSEGRACRSVPNCGRCSRWEPASFCC